MTVRELVRRCLHFVVRRLGVRRISREYPQAISMGHVLRLKSAVAKLAEDKAQNERRQADRADEKAQVC